MLRKFHWLILAISSFCPGGRSTDYPAAWCLHRWAMMKRFEVRYFPDAPFLSTETTWLIWIGVMICHDDWLVGPSWFIIIHPIWMRLKQLTSHQKVEILERNNIDRVGRQKGGKDRKHHSPPEVTHSDTTTMTWAFIWVLNHGFKFHTFPDVEVSELLDRDITPDDYEMCQHSMSKASNCTCERWFFFLPIPPKLPLLVVLSLPYIILHFPSETWNRFDDDRHHHPISTGFVSKKWRTVPTLRLLQLDDALSRPTADKQSLSDKGIDVTLDLGLVDLKIVKLVLAIQFWTCNGDVYILYICLHYKTMVNSISSFILQVVGDLDPGSISVSVKIVSRCWGLEKSLQSVRAKDRTA